MAEAVFVVENAGQSVGPPAGVGNCVGDGTVVTVTVPPQVKELKQPCSTIYNPPTFSFIAQNDMNNRNNIKLLATVYTYIA